MAHQRRSQLLFGIGCIVQLLGSQHHLLYLLFGRQFHRLLVGGIHHAHLVLVSYQFLHGAVHLVQRHLLVKQLGALQVLIYRQHRLVGQEVLYASVHIVRVTEVVTLVGATLCRVQVDALGTCQLTLCESVLTGTLYGTYCGKDATQYVVLLTADRQREAVLGSAHKEAAGPGRSTLEGRNCLLAHLSQSVVQHRPYQGVHIVATQVLHVTLLRIGRSVTLLVEVEEHDGLFGVFLDIHDHRVVVVDGIVDALCTDLGQGDGREDLLDFLLHLVHVDVAHHYDSLQVGAIPLVIVVAQVLIGEVVHDVHRADGHAVLILRTLVDLRHGLLHQSLYGLAGTAGAPLFVYHAALLVYLLVLQQQEVAPVVQDEQTRVGNALTLHGHRRDVIHRLVYGGIGVQVGTELHADGLTPGHDAQFLSLAWEVLRTVESHVLQEVSQSTLARLFQDGTHALGDVEVGQSLVLGIMADIVRHAVLQLTRTDCRVLRQRLCLQGGCHRQESQKSDKCLFHNYMLLEFILQRYGLFANKKRKKYKKFTLSSFLGIVYFNFIS